MPLTTTFTEEMVQGLAPDEAIFKRAQELATAKKFLNLGASADGTWLFGECQGSGTEPYQVSADFHDPNNPVLRSSSPSRKTPDKYGIALLLAYVKDPAAFGTREPSEDLLIKREKKIAMDEKKKSGSAAPRKVNKAAKEKKTAAQREGLELLEKLLVELVGVGQWFETSRVEKIEKQSKQLSDAFLPMPMFGLRKLMLLAKAKDLNDEEKMASATDVLGQLWAMVQKGRAYLDQKLHGEETQAEADAVIEDMLGKAWQMTELKEKGYFLTDLSLFELAFERTDDESRQQRVEISNLLDMNSGAIHQATVYRPFKGLNQVPEQASYMQPLTVNEAALYPGFTNRRIRWEKGIEQLNENPPANFLQTAYALTNPDFKAVLETFRNQLKHPLAPRDAVFFVACDRIGKIGEKVFLQDATGTRIEMKDRRKDYSNVANLVRAAGMMGKDKPGVLVRLSVVSATNTIVGQPLAALTGKHHLRLGL